MENGEIFGEDYFEQLLEEIREIRLSELRFYQKVTDIYTTASAYDPNAAITTEFFATVQNKLHFAIHGRTAAELIKERADASKPHMGLSTWRNGPEGKILKGDVTIGTNYLKKDELDELGRLLEAYLNLAESRAKRRVPTTMSQWVDFLDQVQLLENTGSILKKVADAHAWKEYESFRLRQDHEYSSYFDRFQDADMNPPISDRDESSHRPEARRESMGSIDEADGDGPQRRGE